MKLLVIGCGQCGGRIADEFARLSRIARIQRGIQVTSSVLAVNTDVADLSGLSHIESDYQHRVLIGGKKAGGHGVGKINEIGAEVAREDGDKVIESIRAVQGFPETDAFLVIASAAGGTGSGAVPALTQLLKERYIDKPVYNLIVLPFKYEEMTEERSIYNVGTCLKSAYLVADSIFLVDNQRFVKKNLSISNNLSAINYSIVKPFYNLLCAGEETNPKYIGSRVVDAGDIIQTLAGWSVIGFGEAHIRRSRLRVSKKLHFRNKVTETEKGAQAMDQALGELSLKCNPTDARRALYLLTAPPEEMHVDIIRDLAGSLRGIASEATIRSGDYPRGKSSLEVTVVLSELTNSQKVMDYFSKTLDYISIAQKRRGRMQYERTDIEESLKDIPSLL
ncbi:tubulin/FtsZ family protein [Chloroflexota bacterium]